MRAENLDPEKALKELYSQEQILKVSVDIQALLQLLVEKEIITRNEINIYRDKVLKNPKYGKVKEQIQEEIKAMNYAKDHPEEYLKAMLNAKLNNK